MKKSLIALAVMAVAGTAFAQSSVALTGKLAFGYQMAEGAGATPKKANGLGVTDGDFVLTAKEDLGNGLSATASMAVKSRGRGTDIEGRDASLRLTGGFGSVMIGAVEAGNGIIGLGGADAPTMGLDGAKGIGGISRDALDDASNVDILMYSMVVNGFGGHIAVLDNKMGKYGMHSSEDSLDATLLRVTYAGGPFAFMADYTNYGSNSAGTAAAAAAGEAAGEAAFADTLLEELINQAASLEDAIDAATDAATDAAALKTTATLAAAQSGAPDKRFRISGSYDLGMAKLGAGYQTKDNVAGVNNKQYILGVSAPFGPVTVGANYVRNKQENGTTIKGYELGADYALSKRTSVEMAYQNIEETTVAGDATAFRIRLMHKF